MEDLIKICLEHGIVGILLAGFFLVTWQLLKLKKKKSIEDGPRGRMLHKILNYCFILALAAVVIYAGSEFFKLYAQNQTEVEGGIDIVDTNPADDEKNDEEKKPAQNSHKKKKKEDKEKTEKNKNTELGENNSLGKKGVNIPKSPNPLLGKSEMDSYNRELKALLLKLEEKDALIRPYKARSSLNDDVEHNIEHLQLLNERLLLVEEIKKLNYRYEPKSIPMKSF